MNSEEIFNAIEKIANTPGKNDKIALVTEYAKVSPEFVRVLEYTYSPFKTFGINKMPVGKAHEGFKAFDEATWQILDDLISRKLTGNAARDVVAAEIDQLAEYSAELFRRIIRKNLRADFSESTCNKAVKKLIPEFPYMRCSLPKDTDLTLWPWEKGVFVQEKADGMFANIDHEIGGLVRVTTRQGNELPIEKFEALVADVRECTNDGLQHHGEIVVYRDGVLCDRADGNGVLNRIQSGGDFAPNERPVYLIWDAIPLELVVPKGKYNQPYRTRFATVLQKLKSVKPALHVGIIPTIIAKSMRAATEHYRKLLAQGKEGVILKHPDAIWKDGTSNEQIKFKLEVDVDLKIVRIVTGRLGTKNEGRPGSFSCESSCGKLAVDVTVKNEALRNRVEANPEKFIGKILVVRANELLEPSESNSFYSLFLPRMAEQSYRTDKSVADDLAQIRKQFENAIKGE
jgi:DNA ligase-1